MDAEPLAGVPVEGRQWIATTAWGPLGGIVYEATLQVPSGLILPKSVDGAETFPISSVAHLEQLPGGWRRRERQPLCRLAHRGGVARHGEAGQVGSLERRPGTQRFESYLESSAGGSTWGTLTTADATPAKTGTVCTGGSGCSAARESGHFQGDAIDASGNVDLSYVRVLQPNQTLVMFDQVP